MNSKPLTNPNSWSLKPKKAVALQKQLALKVIRSSGIDIEDVATVAGVDTHYHQGLAIAAVVVIRLCDLATVDHATAVKKISFPYIPGLLTFREGPAILAALDHLTAAPDLLIFDGQGIAHPRRCGLASHIGLLLDMPAIGCAKTRLSGRYEEPHTEKGSYSYLKDGDETIGAVVRTRSKVKPVFVSIGHRVNLQDSINIVLQCCSRYRLPETTRRADKLARSRGFGKSVIG
jgi:deoxyribonuclease V